MLAAALPGHEPHGGSERSGVICDAKTFGSPSEEPSAATRLTLQQKCEKLWTLPGEAQSPRVMKSSSASQKMTAMVTTACNARCTCVKRKDSGRSRRAAQLNSWSRFLL